MITLQHTLISYLYYYTKPKKTFFEDIPYILLPDAIRYYTKNRQSSHFEIAKNQEISWLRYPLDLKDEQLIKGVRGHKDVMQHIVDEKYIPKCVIGEETILASFENTNQHLPTNYFNGVRYHLIQDRVFDKFIRNIFDCSKMYEDIFNYKGKTYNGVEFRKLINNIEQQGVLVLSKYMWERYNITTNQEWFDVNIYPQLKKIYSEKMAENTYKYMKIDKDINNRITNHDFDNVNYIVPYDVLDYMYKQTIIAMYIEGENYNDDTTTN